MINYIRVASSLTYFDPNGSGGFSPKQVSSDHPFFDDIFNACVEGNIEKARKLYNVRDAIAVYTNGLLTIDAQDNVFLTGKPASGYVIDKMLALRAAGENITPLTNFINLLQSNPNEEVREDLYKWMEKGNMPLTPDGYFIAYKKVQDDYYSYYHGANGKVLHAPGTLVQMPRSECDESRYQTCSSGLHFCSFTYLRSYHGNTGKVMAVMINPANVTAIPTDYNLAKGRCCEYFVLNEVDGTTVEFAFAGHEVYRNPSATYVTSEVEEDPYEDEYEDDGGSEWDADDYSWDNDGWGI